MQQFEDGGIIYEDIGNGQVRVIGPASQQAPAPVTLGKPRPKDPPAGYNWNGGNLAPIPGGPADKPREDPNAPKLPSGYRWKPDGSAELIPGVSAPGAGSKTSAKERSDAIQGYQDAAAIARTVADLRKRYKEGPGQTGGIKGALDYLPTDENQQFNDAGQRSRGYVKRALGFTGGEGNTLGESTMLYDPYLPDTWDKDGRIESKIAALEQLGKDAERRSIAILGGVPDANGNVSPVDPNSGPPQLFQEQPERDETPAIQGVDRSVNPFMSAGQQDPNTPQKTLGTQRRYSTDEDMAIRARLEAMYDSGATAAQMNAVAMQFGKESGYDAGLPPDKVAEAIAWRDGVGKYADRKQYPYSRARDVVTAPQNGRRNDIEIMANKALLHPAGTALTTATSALGFGALEALAPDAIAQQRETNPMSAFAGDVTGMIGGTSLIAKAGEKVASKFAPQLLGGGGKAQFARSLAPDVAYGAAYNGITQGDPLTGAASAAAGNLGGRAIGKTFGGLIGGVDDDAVKYLTERNIPLSPGQVLGNRGIIGRMYNKMESAPIVGDLMARNRVDGLKAFEREALNDVVSPIGGRVTQGGADGLMEAQGAVSNAYGDALSGASAPVDRDFINTLVNEYQFDPRSLPSDLSEKYNRVQEDFFNNTINRQIDARNIDVNAVTEFGQGAGIAKQNVNFGKNNFPGNPDPVSVVKLNDGSDYLLDGFHRTATARKNGTTQIPANEFAVNGTLANRLKYEGVDPSNVPDIFNLSGDDYQQVMRRLKGYKAEKTGPGFEERYRDGVGLMEDSLRDAFSKHDSGLQTRLSAADSAFSRLAPFENARIGAVNQEAITPAQLSRAVTSNTKKFGGRASAAAEKNISDLMKYGQEVLPSTIPNSGTADRLGGLSAMLLPTALGGGAYGVSTLTDNPGYAIPLATLAALSTKTGQKAFQAAATKRPKSARRIAGMFGGQKAQKGLAGMITAPLLVDD